jgi:deoxycytidylate deaminase
MFSLDTTPPDKYIITGTTTAEQLAISASKNSNCQKSTRGCVIYNPRTAWFAIGFNSPPQPLFCSGKCFDNCNKFAIHAEQMCINEALKIHRSAFGCVIAHVKTVGGNLVPSGEPSCWQCSRAMLEAGLSGMWLYHDYGWKLYDVLSFHKETLKNCGIDY